MGDSDGSDGSASSGYRTPSPQPRDPDAKIRLARIFISHDGNIGCEWHGTKPNPGDTLFLYYVEVSDETYRSYIPLDTFRHQDYERLKKIEANRLERFPIERRTFEHMKGTNDNFKCYYIHKPEDERHSRLKETRQGELLLNLMRSGRILQNNTESSCWYMLNGPDDYTNDYHNFKENYDFFDVRIIGNAEEFKKGYTPLSTDILTHLDAHLLFREIGQPSRRPRTRSRSPPGGRSPLLEGSGKTRRKFKVKKRRNRRIRNTMKRRKTALKRRNR
jgi:hypothetical protein